MICVAFAGIDRVAIDACRRQGAAVCNCAVYSASAVADLIFGLVIALYHLIVPVIWAVRDGESRKEMSANWKARRSVLWYGRNWAACNSDYAGIRM